MPYYDFECPDCGHRFEESLGIAERNREDVACPCCGRIGARRAVSAPNLGSGARAAMPSFPT